MLTLVEELNSSKGYKNKSSRQLASRVTYANVLRQAVKVDTGACKGDVDTVHPDIIEEKRRKKSVKQREKRRINRLTSYNNTKNSEIESL